MPSIYNRLNVVTVEIRVSIEQERISCIELTRMITAHSIDNPFNRLNVATVGSRYWIIWVSIEQEHASCIDLTRIIFVRLLCIGFMRIKIYIMITESSVDNPSIVLM